MTTLKVLMTSSALVLLATLSAGAQQPATPVPHPLRLRQRRPHRWSMGRRSLSRRRNGQWPLPRRKPGRTIGT